MTKTIDITRFSHESVLKVRGLLSWIIVCGLVMLLVSGNAWGATNQSQFMKIKVVDQRTGRGIPLVQVRTNHPGGVSFFTDSQGIAAVREPGLMGEEVKLEIRSPGYVHNRVGSSTHKLRLKLAAGESRLVEMKRNFEVGTDPGFSDVVLDRNIAERLYRLTGSGIYRESWLVGEAAPIDDPLLNANVVTQGGANNAVFRDRLFWFFGPEGAPPGADFRHQLSGATSNLWQGLDPTVGVNLEYFENSEGSSRSVFPTSGGETVTLNSLLVPQIDSPEMYAQFQLVSDNDSV